MHLLYIPSVCFWLFHTYIQLLVNIWRFFSHFPFNLYKKIEWNLLLLLLPENLQIVVVSSDALLYNEVCKTPGRLLCCGKQLVCHDDIWKRSMRKFLCLPKWKSQFVKTSLGLLLSQFLQLSLLLFCFSPIASNPFKIFPMACGGIGCCLESGLPPWLGYWKDFPLISFAKWYTPSGASIILFVSGC